MLVWVVLLVLCCLFFICYVCFCGVLLVVIVGISWLLDGYDLILVVGVLVFCYYQFVFGDYLLVGVELVQVICDFGEVVWVLMGDVLVGDIVLIFEVLFEQVCFSVWLLFEVLL